MTAIVRPFTPADADGWVRCRVLSLLRTSYFDDVKTEPTRFDLPVVRLVADEGGEIVGLIDVEVDGSLATIDSIAVVPSAQGQGIATALFDAALQELPPTVTEVDAWTREDTAANAWYRCQGFVAEQHYLHVYKGWADDAESSTLDGLRVVSAFMHADLADEKRMRARFERVHVCRRYVVSAQGALRSNHD
jgi:ribosomal protein S18 acetylase RimI-like enzyme